ncbi:MAG: hypothetical protein MJ252_00695 [archaeon]|nr:hypothetical protein [archaeon]
MDDIDLNVRGEILIPLENTLTSNENNYLKENDFNDLSTILDKNYRNFRSVIFQNELLRFFLVLKFSLPDFVELPNADEKEVSMKMKYLSLIVDNLSLTTEIEYVNDDTEKKVKNPNKNRNTNGVMSTEIKKDLSVYENLIQPNMITKRYIFEKENIVILEIKKHILVSNTNINKASLLKLELYIKEELGIGKINPKSFKFVNGIGDMKHHSFNILELEKYVPKNETGLRLFNTFFKEINVIKPLQIIHTSQFDYSQECSIMQIRISNVTSDINYFDSSLVYSQFLKGKVPEYKDEQEEEKFDYDNLIYKNERKERSKEVHFGIIFQINDIIIQKEETFLKNKMILSLEREEQIVQREQLPIQLKEISFEILGIKFPLNLFPGEEFNLTLKLNKSQDFYSSIDMAIFSQSKNESEVRTIEKNSEIGFSANILNLIGNSGDSSDVDSKGKQKDDTSSNFALEKIKDNYNPGIKKKRKKIPFLSKFDKVNSNLTDKADKMDKIQEVNEDYSGISNYLNPNSTKGKRSIRLLSGDTDQMETGIYDIVKLDLCTPIILSFDCLDHYENMLMTVYVTWKTEIENQLRIYFEIEKDQEPFLINKLLSIRFSFKNLSNSLCDYEMDFDSSLDEFKEYVEKAENNPSRYKKACDDHVPDMLNEMKNVIIGKLQPKEEKATVLNFLPLKSGFISLPNFFITELISGKKFFVVHTNRIYINEKK